MKIFLLMITTVIAVCYSTLSLAQATINNNVSVTFTYPVPLTGSGSVSKPDYTMEGFKNNDKYKIVVVEDSPLMANNIAFSVNGASYISEDVFTYITPPDNGATKFNVSYYLNSGTTTGQTQLLKFQIFKKRLFGAIYDWQSTFFYYIYSDCPNNEVLSSQWPLSAGDYEVTNSLDVKMAVKPNGGLVELDGGSSVNLLPGFISDLSAGGAVQAIIDGCGGSYRIANPALANSDHKDEMLDNNIHIYPNPSSGVFNIEFKDISVQKITIYDALGKIVFENDISNDSTNASADLSEFTSGIYFVKINTGEKVLMKKVIKN